LHPLESAALSRRTRQADIADRDGSWQSRRRTTLDTDKIEASLKKGVLTVTLRKTAEAQKPIKQIEVKGA
jgi:Hsp20/alpha crystallin family